jgi:uncharacterized membrane protein YhdT
MNYSRYAVKTLTIYFIVVYTMISCLLGDAYPVWNVNLWPGEMVVTLILIPIFLAIIHTILRRFYD